MANRKGGKIKFIVFLLLFIILGTATAAGYIGVKQWWAKNQPRTFLTAVKIDADVLSWSFRHLPEFYVKIVALDDVIALLETESDRLKELEKKYPDQKNIISEERTELKAKKDELTNIIDEATNAIEAIYVAYEINTRKAKSRIGSKEAYELGKKLTSTLKNSNGLVYRIKSQNPEKWTDKLLKIF
jgi:hypothetical protein